MYSKDLEKELSQFTGVKYCFLCDKGRNEASALAFRGIGVGTGKAVFVPALGSSVMCDEAAETGASVVLYDVCRMTFNGEGSSLEAAVEAVLNEGNLEPAAIVTTDLFGLPADYPAIREVADRHGLLVVEDAGHGFGGTLHNKWTGSLGDIAVTDFGAVFTNDDSLADQMRTYHNPIGEVDDISADALLKELSDFRKTGLQAINMAADEYSERLAGCCSIPVVPCGFTSAWERYAIRLRDEEERNSLHEYLQTAGIPSTCCDDAMSGGRMDFAKKNGVRRFVSLRNAEEFCRTALCLPIYPGITCGEIVNVADTLLTFYRRGRRNAECFQNRGCSNQSDL